MGGSSVGNTATVERMRITANGAVGINTTAPGYQLDTKGFGRISTTTFTGTGLNDGATGSGTYTGTDTSIATYTVIIDGTGTPDTFKWQKNGGSFTTGVAITGSNQSLTDGVRIKFTATTGHTLNDQWVITVLPVNPFGVQNAAGTRALAVANSGNVGIGTTTPWRKLSVTGTVGFDGLTGAIGAGSLCLSSNKEVVYNSGSDNCLSSLRSTKHDINTLTLSGTSTLAALVPVSFIYNDDASSTVRYGFIAEDTAAVDSHLATYDQQGKLSGVDDRALLSIVVKALQELMTTVAGFADNIVSAHITVVTGDFIQVNTQKLCVKKSDGTPVCINGDQLAAVLTNANQTAAGSPTVDAPSTPDTTPPTITIVGDNPTHIHVGDSYADLGASVTDNVDQNLGLKYFLNGALVSNIVIDTSAAATDTINYVATDMAGNTATTTRTVIVESPATAEPAPAP